MSSESQWGGKRPNAGSGGKREGAGRPRSRITLKSNSIWIMERSERPGALPDKPRQWRVLSVDEHQIEFQDVETEEIFVIIKADEY